MLRRGYTVLCVAMAFIIGTPRALSAQAHSIDTRNSKLRVYVFKSGLLAGFADNHQVEAPRRQQVQERMLGPDVLDSSRFPLITFESTDVRHGERGEL